jgi:hypothetical protein
MLKGWVVAWLVCAFMGLVACSGSTSGGGGGGASGGSSTCATWQDAMCDFGVDRCQLLADRASCDDDYRSIRCKSDAAAQACLDKLAAATCGTALPECSFAAVADPAPAIAACNNFVSEICARARQCDPTLTAEACDTQTRQGIDCSLAIGVTADFNSCISAVRTMDCNASALPSVCQGVVKSQ